MDTRSDARDAEIVRLVSHLPGVVAIYALVPPVDGHDYYVDILRFSNEAASPIFKAVLDAFGPESAPVMYCHDVRWPAQDMVLARQCIFRREQPSRPTDRLFPPPSPHCPSPTPSAIFPRRVGHDHHFLERLDRVTRPDVEFALSLYRDDQLLKFVLERARVAAGVERVAIALRDGPDPPHLIVARDGGFVTCLGAGMSPDPWPVIPRSQLDAIAAHVVTLRERMELARTLVGPGVETTRLLGKIQRAGLSLSREDLLGIAAFQPLMPGRFLLDSMDTGVALSDARKTIMAVVLPARRRTDQHDELLERYWRLMWSLGHLFVLAGMAGPELWTPGVTQYFADGPPPSWPLIRHEMPPLALRAAWAIARFGKPVLPMYKARYQKATTPRQAMDGGIGLFALGARHSRLTAETQKTLSSSRLTDHESVESESDKALYAYRNYIATLARASVENPEEFGAMQRHYAADRWAVHSRVYPDTPVPDLTTDVDKVPDWLGLAYSANLPWRPAEPADRVLFTLAMVPAVARADAEDLYLPREFTRAIRWSWSPDDTLNLLREVAPPKRAAVPVRTTATPGRNDPCSCGSGRKYKRCCAA